MRKVRCWAYGLGVRLNWRMYQFKTFPQLCFTRSHQRLLCTHQIHGVDLVCCTAIEDMDTGPAFIHLSIPLNDDVVLVIGCFALDGVFGIGTRGEELAIAPILKAARLGHIEVKLQGLGSGRAYGRSGME